MEKQQDRFKATTDIYDENGKVIVRSGREVPRDMLENINKTSKWMLREKIIVEMDDEDDDNSRSVKA